jgi:hypothetical protein
MAISRGNRIGSLYRNRPWKSSPIRGNYTYLSVKFEDLEGLLQSVRLRGSKSMPAHQVTGTRERMHSLFQVALVDHEIVGIISGDYENTDLSSCEGLEEGL